MSNFVDTMRLKGMAEEDIYFARRDRELIAALREKRLARKLASGTSVLPTNSDRAATHRKAPE